MPLFLSLTWSMNCLADSPFLRMSSSISTTSWFAPPCKGPQSAQMPALMEAKRFVCALPTIRTVLVEQFCSWSACRMSSRFSARTATGSGRYGSAGPADVMCREFAQESRSVRGEMDGGPKVFLYENAALGGSFPHRRAVGVLPDSFGLPVLAV